MKVLIIGAGGMIGQKLASALAEQATLNHQALNELELVDIAKPAAPHSTSVTVTTQQCDFTDPAVVAALIASRPDVIFHLAAIVSGEAEVDFAKGYRINLDGTRGLLEAIRTLHEADGFTPQLISASSVAVFGAPFPAVIGDDFHQTPLTSYGTQKAMGELLLTDYNRRGIVQGIGLRLPTICIRPGTPNKAASGFFSNILREPINGQTAVLPVEDTVRHWFASPRAAVGFFLHAATLDRDTVGPRCNLNLPGLSATVAEEIEALERVVGSDALTLIRREPDAGIASIVSNWATAFQTDRANALGFTAEQNFDEIIRVYLEDEMTTSP